MRFFIYHFSFFLLFSHYVYAEDFKKELTLLESFDIQQSFIYDPIMDDIRLKKYKEAKYFFQALNDAYLFIPTIKQILVQNNIPKEFLYLAMTESSLNAKVTSNKSAAGVWQFIPATALEFHLKIDRFVDERRDIIKSTKAASKFLQQLYKKFGKWYLAAIAYNCGAARLKRGIKAAKSDELSVLLDKNHSYIPKESKRYIRKIVAFTLFANDEKFLVESGQTHLLNISNTHTLSTITLQSGESLKRVSKLLNIPFKKLQNLNRHLKYSCVPKYLRECDVYIPYKSLFDFKQKYYVRKSQQRFKIYSVKKGEDVMMISKKYGVFYKEILRINKLDTIRVRENQKLFIPLDDGLNHIQG